MGQAASIPERIPPPLSDDTDDSEEDEVLLLDSILGNENGKETTEEVSIVFMDEDDDEEEEIDEDDIYLDDRNDSFDFNCFGLPLFSMTTHFTAVADPSDKLQHHDDEDEDEDPRENIESLQFELKVVDAFYNHHTRNSKTRTNEKFSQEEKEEEEEFANETNNTIKSVETDTKVEFNDNNNEEEKEDVDEDEELRDNVVTLRRELQHAEETFQTGNTKDCQDDRNSNNQSVSEESQRSTRSSSFIDLQQLLFSPAAGTDDDDHSSIHYNNNNKTGGSVSSCSLFSSSSSSTTKSSRVIEIYETRSTQLKPQSEDEKEKVPLERMGIPFRKCRDPSCSCHHASLKRRDNGRSRHRERNRKMIEKYHASNNTDSDDEKDSSTFTSRQTKRRSTLHRLQQQREKLLAMDYYDDDDSTDVTTESFSSSSRYSGYSIRSDCQNNTRKNHLIRSNPDRRYRSQRSQSEDLDERLTHGRKGISKEHVVSPPQSDIPQSESSLDARELEQTKEQQSPPPIPSRRSFGSKNDQKHKTYPSPALQQGSQSIRKISFDSNVDDNRDGTPRRCRSEDFIDSTSTGGIIATPRTNKPIKDTRGVFEIGDQGRLNGDILPSPNASRRKRSFSAHVSPSSVNTPPMVPDQEEVDVAREPKDRRNLSVLTSPTCIMEEMQQDGSYPRSRTTQHQNLLEQLDRIHQQLDTSSNESSPRRRTRTESINIDDEDPCFSRLFYEREKSLKEYRQSIRILQKEEKMDRCQEQISNKHKTLRRASRKQQKQRKHQHQQRCFRRAMKMADLYHSMGVIHYQQGRYETARYVLQCGVDALVSNRASCAPLEQELFEDTVDPFDEDYSSPYFACAPSRLLPLLPTLDEAAPHLSNAALLLAAELIVTQGKVLAAQGAWKDTKESSSRVLQWSAFQKQRLDNVCCQQQHHPHYIAEQHNKYWMEWGPRIAHAQVLFARCCEKEHRPDIAMRYYQEALSVQKNTLGSDHIQAADTLYRMGNLHATSGLLGLAGQCYDEALCIYRRHRQVHDNEVEACVFADEATALAALGWIFLVQNDLVRALALTKEAMDGMVRALGSSHRNVLSLNHQLVCIQNALAFPAQFSKPGFAGQTHSYR